MAAVNDAVPPGRRTMAFAARRYLHGLRTEGEGAGREAAAIGVGVFIGCLPAYGLHLVLCWAVGWLFGLNRVKTYLAANISNPLVAPWLLFSELQIGSWLRRGEFHAATIGAIRKAGIGTITTDLVLGSLVLGAALAVLAAWATHRAVRGDRQDRWFVDLVRRAADRYAGVGITAWEFARGKLRHDPVYRAAVAHGLLGTGTAGPGGAVTSGTLVDVGCGQGLMLALLAEARERVRSGTWSEPFHPPCFDTLIGVETRPRIARMAAVALGNGADIRTQDARAGGWPPADCVLLFDVLHMMPLADQERLLASLRSSLAPGGCIVIRDADAAAGWRFTAVRTGNQIKALAFGHWRQRFYFRSSAEWAACFARLGLHADARPMGEGTPFGNVLFRLTAAVSTKAPSVSTAPTSRAAPVAGPTRLTAS